MDEIADIVARIVSAPVAGVTIHTFRFNGELAKTADDESHFITTKDVSDLLCSRAAEAAAAIITRGHIP